MNLRTLTQLFVLASLAAGCSSSGDSGPKQPDARSEQDLRMAWWREARFGMFIHWGLYSIPAGEWKGKTDHAEWIRETAQIPVEEYEKFQAQFNPVKFDAEAWARMAADAGMKYLVITSKHHDGFGLFDSTQTAPGTSAARRSSATSWRSSRPPARATACASAPTTRSWTGTTPTTCRVAAGRRRSGRAAPTSSASSSTCTRR